MNKRDVGAIGLGAVIGERISAARIHASSRGIRRCPTGDHAVAALTAVSRKRAERVRLKAAVVDGLSVAEKCEKAEQAQRPAIFASERIYYLS